MTWLIATAKFLGWRGFLALVLLLMLALANRDRDAQAERAANLDRTVEQRDATIDRLRASLRSAGDSLGRCATDIRTAAGAGRGWQDITGKMGGLLDHCQAENARLDASARAAHRRAEAVEAAAGKRLGQATQRWNNRSTQCDAALKSMEVACAGL